VFEEQGFCSAGWKCRFVQAHSKEVEHEDGRKELVLVVDESKAVNASSVSRQEEVGIFNVIPVKDRIDLNRKRVKTVRADQYLQWLDSIWKIEQQEAEKRQAANIRSKLTDKEREVADRWNGLTEEHPADAAPAPDTKEPKPEGTEAGTTEAMDTGGNSKPELQEKSEVVKTETETEPAAMDTDVPNKDESTEVSRAKVQDNRALYSDPPFRASEKRRLYYGPETPVLAPLTTQGNLPFRRLCISLGAGTTFSEMAVGLPLVTGEKSEWALMRAHQSEVSPPTVSSKAYEIPGYDNSKDVRFGVQIAAAKPWVALKTTEVLAKYCPNVRVIDLNCGCPIDLVTKTGAGSALLDMPAKMEKIVRGMNALSGEIPISVKLRLGVRDFRPNALAVAKRLILGGHEARDTGMGPSGVAAITLHGRSKQQRYTREADWSYIAEVATMINSLRLSESSQADTAREADARDLPNGGRVFFLGNGDVYSHVDYNTHLTEAKVDSVMIGRGALIKPWLFEEISSGQHLDKSATERLEYIRTFVSHGLNCWGSDEMGIGTTRRFLLEWLSFSHRYVPVGLLETLPPRLNERPPKYRGRNELETLLASDNYRDWIKISEMFLGKTHKDFNFTPKHKSNSYETEG
jgi:tRNA-dihydrouridine synthase 3